MVRGLFVEVVLVRRLAEEAACELACFRQADVEARAFTAAALALRVRRELSIVNVEVVTRLAHISLHEILAISRCPNLTLRQPVRGLLIKVVTSIGTAEMASAQVVACQLTAALLFDLQIVELDVLFFTLVRRRAASLCTELLFALEV